MSRSGKKKLAFRFSESLSESHQRRIVAALERIFRDRGEGAGSIEEDARTHDFVFHLVDWYDDLVRFAKVMKNPDGADDEERSESVLRFLIHASGHVAAAARIAGHEPIEFKLPKRRSAARRRRNGVRASKL